MFTPPSENLYTSPLVGIGINKEWMKHLIGYLSDMRWRWFGENATYEGNNEIERFINLIVLGQPTMFIGQIIIGSWDTPPANLLPCDGATYNGGDYPELYNALHPNHKDELWGTFQVPDLSGKFPLGVEFGSSKYQPNTVGGEEQVQLTVGQMPRHAHPPPAGSTQMFSNLGVQANFTAGTGVRSISETGYTGNDEPHNNMPPYGVVMYYIVATL